MIPMASGSKHRKPKDSSSTRTAAIAVVLGAGVVSPLVLASGASAAPTSAWDRIAECESGGRWNLPYGDASSTGGLQIQAPTWADYGGLAVAPAPYLATKAQQIAIAEKILASQGPSAWTCNAMTGYPLQSSGPNSSYLKGGINPNVGTTVPVTPPKPVPPKPHPHYPNEDMREGAAPTRYTPHTVVSGDTLYGIAGKHTGDWTRDNWRALYAANQQTIGADPDLILPGQHLRVPVGRAHSAPHVPAPRPPKPAPVTPAHGAYVLPVAGRVGDSLIIGPGGCISRTCGGHSGLDITANTGTPVHAAAAGTVVNIGGAGAAYGNHLSIKHAGGIYTLYAHLSRINVTVGQTVTAGQVIGNVGSTGNASGPHLHFEVRTDPTAFTVGTFLNPLVWLRSHGITV